MGYNAVQSFESQPTFRRNISPPPSESKNKPSKAFLATCFVLVSCLVYSLILKMKAIYSSETSINFQRTTRVISQKTVFFKLYRVCTQF
jgi:hypothetical protein